MSPWRKRLLYTAAFIAIIFIKIFFFTQPIETNDYLNPYTITFKNPKTVEMLNIIILYHYIMAFLVGIIIFTFIFIFLSFFRTYPFFYNKLRLRPIFEYGPPEDNYERMRRWQSRTEVYFANLKSDNMEFYAEDIKNSLDDQVTHAPLLEFLWVILPAVILVLIAYPSIIMLYYNEAYIDPIFNISAIGNQWFWTYEYNDFNLIEVLKRHVTSEKARFIKELNYAAVNVLEYTKMYPTKFSSVENFYEKDKQALKDIPLRFTVDSNLIIAKDPKFLRLLSTDQCLVLPSKTPVRLLITSNDVIHSWAVPSYGVKVDAVPGRINQQILTIPLSGTSWGQCSELCGVNHAYMPIEVKVLAFGDFLFFMELKLKEILAPYLTAYYESRLETIRQFIRVLKENPNDPDLGPVVADIKHLRGVMNYSRLVASAQKNV